MTLLQETVEPERQGRVFGLLGIVMAVATPVGMVILGPLADVVPIEAIMIGTGLLTFLVIAVAVWSPAGRRAVRPCTRRRAPRPPDGPPRPAAGGRGATADPAAPRVSVPDSR